MKKNTYISLAVIITSLLSLTDAQVSKNPCHRTRRTSGQGQTSCETYIVPKKLCGKCRLKKWNKQTGEFFSCRGIYDVKAPNCVKKMRSYVSKNPCDKKRAEQMEDLDNADNLDGLDYFLYSICESCCDCIPMGSKRSEYKARKSAGTLFKSDRGNCPAHARADVCKVWPNVKGVGNTASDIANLPRNLEPVCPQFNEWLEDIQQQGGWFKKPEVPISPQLRVFLDQLSETIGCSSKGAWKDCVNMETAQTRL